MIAAIVTTVLGAGAGAVYVLAYAYSSPRVGRHARVPRQLAASQVLRRLA